MRFFLPAIALTSILSSQLLADSVTVEWGAPRVSIQRSQPEVNVEPPVDPPQPREVPLEMIPAPELAPQPYLQVPLVLVNVGVSGRACGGLFRCRPRAQAPLPPTTVTPTVAVTSWRWGLLHRRAIPRTRIMAGSIYAGPTR